jgi:hypothetical protein
MNPQEYRAQVIAEVQAAGSPNQGYKVFLDKSQPDEVRQSSLNASNGLPSGDEVTHLCQAAMDSQESDEIRASALQRLAYDGRNIDSAIDTVLKNLADSTASTVVRYSAFHALKQLLFVSPALREKRSDYLAILRGLVFEDSADEALRIEALELLARRKDPQIQEYLNDCLQGKTKSLTSLAQTIQLLGNDIHSDVYPFLRKIVEEPPDDDTAHEAVRVLSADPSSANFLGNIYLDKKRSEQVRRAGGIAIQSLDPSLFESLAKQIAVDDTAPEGLRTTTIQSLERFANPTALGRDTEFKKLLDETEKSQSSLQLNRSVQRLQFKLQ